VNFDQRQSAKRYKPLRRMEWKYSFMNF